LPNIEGVQWFLDYVYPYIEQNKHAFKIFLAGKSMPDYFMKLTSENLIVSGRVEDSKSFMVDKPIMIVPLLSGGGMRVKIIEGLAMGKTIISTTIGAEGIKYTNGKNILIADTPEEFYAAIVKCTSDIKFCKEVGKNARQLAVTVYENEIIGKELLKFYNTLQNKKSDPIQVTGRS
jgi:glycosyltransferase involved in cell wall biosynthesis